MHSGRIVIANRSAVGLKGVLFPCSKAIKSILNHWGENIGVELSNVGAGGTWRKDLNGPSSGGVWRKERFSQKRQLQNRIILEVHSCVIEEKR